MFDEKFSYDFRTIIGDGSLTVGFVEHLVEALRPKCTLHKVAKCYGGRHQFLRDIKTAGHGCSRAYNSNRGSPATVVCSSHQSLAGGSCS